MIFAETIEFKHVRKKIGLILSNSKVALIKDMWMSFIHKYICNFISMQSIPGESHTIGVNGLSCHGEMDLSETLSKSNSSRSSVSPAPPLALTGGWVKAPASHCTVAGSNTQL